MLPPLAKPLLHLHLTGVVDGVPVGGVLHVRSRCTADRAAAIVHRRRWVAPACRSDAIPKNGFGTCSCSLLPMRQELRRKLIQLLVRPGQMRTLRTGISNGQQPCRRASRAERRSSTAARRRVGRYRRRRQRPGHRRASAILRSGRAWGAARWGTDCSECPRGVTEPSSVPMNGLLKEFDRVVVRRDVPTRHRSAGRKCRSRCGSRSCCLSAIGQPETRREQVAAASGCCGSGCPASLRGRACP